MSNKIKHIFFDLDHTLWDFDKNSGLTFKKIFKDHKVEINHLDFLQIYEPINLKYWKLYRNEKVSKSELRYGRLKEAFDGLDFKISDNIINLLSEDYINNLSDFNFVFDGAYETLKYLEQKYVLHIITNGFEEIQNKKMKAAKLDGYFKTVTNAEMAGVKKPNPKIFKLALELANAKPEESLMVGDSLEADIQGSIDFGMSAIYFDYKNADYQENYKRITELKELKKLL